MSATLRADYERDGYLCIRLLISRECLDAISFELDVIEANFELKDRNNLRTRYKMEPQSGELLLDALDPVVDIMPSVGGLIELPEVKTLLDEIYGEESFLFKDKLIFKPPGSPGYSWHQDYISWPFFPESFLTLVVPLDEATEENGCIEVVRGSHKNGYLSVSDGDFHDLSETFFDPKERQIIQLTPGDALLFGCYLIHGSKPNRSNCSRRQLYLSFNKKSDGGNQREAHYRFFHSWLRARYQEYGTKDTFFK